MSEIQEKYEYALGRMTEVFRDMKDEITQLRQQLAKAGEAIEARNKELMKMVQEAEKAHPEAVETVFYATVDEYGSIGTEFIFPNIGEAEKYKQDVNSVQGGIKVESFIKLYTHPAPVVPEGYVMVPVEPTLKMLGAGAEHLIRVIEPEDGEPKDIALGILYCSYKAMIKAAQEKAE